MIELKRLRRSKKDLEQRISLLEAKGREDRKALLEATRGTKPGASPAPPVDANTVYVKNVVFNLLSSLNASSIASRTAMVKALVMALKFNRDEESALLHGVVG